MLKMVDKFRIIYNIIRQEKGNVYLFALLKMDKYADKWTVVLSADWALKGDRSKKFQYLREVVVKQLEKEELSKIARLAIFTKESHLVQELSKYGKDTLISDTIKVNGNIVHEGFIYSPSPGDGVV